MLGLLDGALTAPTVQPRYFGDEARQLFGIHHAPSGSIDRDMGVVLCHPAPQEYSQGYWAMHKLAGMLAASGFHALRFDYHGTGDAGGGSDTVTVAGCAADVGTAIAHLRDASGVRRVALVGFRLGAAIAVRAVAEGARVRDLALWEPVIAGGSYLDELDAAESRRLALLHYPEPDERLDDELLGHPFPASLREETRAVDLLKDPLGRVARLGIFTARPGAACDALCDRARSDGIDARVITRPDPVLYAGTGHPTDSLLAHELPVAITAFLGGDVA